MNKSNEYNDLESFFLDVGRNILSVYFDKIKNKESLYDFFDYFEDSVLSDVIGCKSSLGINVFANKGKASDNLRYALLASIDPSGKIDKNLSINNTVDMNREVSIYAKEHIAKKSKEKLETEYGNAVQNLNQLMLKNNNFINPYYLISLGITTEMRNTGYIEDYCKDEDYYQNILFDCYMREKKSLEDNGYEDTLAYDILNYVFDVEKRKNNYKDIPKEYLKYNLYRNYSLASERALENMARLSFASHIEGIDSISKKDVEYTIKNMSAAKIVDESTMSLFEKKFLKEMKESLLKNRISTKTLKK